MRLKLVDFKLISLLVILISSVMPFKGFTIPIQNGSTEDVRPTTSSPTTQENVNVLAMNRPKVVRPKPKESFINRDTQRFYSSDEVQELLAGDQPFYALFRDDLTGRPRGVALLIPDWGGHAANHRGIDSLRTHLPELGWVTLSMTVPSEQDNIHIYEPQSVTATDQQPTAATYQEPKNINVFTALQLSDLEVQIRLRLQAMITEAENHQGYFIVIAQGRSAATVASIYAKEALDKAEALIFLAADQPDQIHRKQMNQDIASTVIPTLDIYPSQGPSHLEANAIFRGKLVRKYYKHHYRQQRMMGNIDDFHHNRKLLKSVYGWLTSLGL